MGSLMVMLTSDHKLSEFLRTVSELDYYSNMDNYEWHNVGESAFEEALMTIIYKPSELLGACLVKNTKDESIVQTLAMKNRFKEIKIILNCLYNVENQIFAPTQYIKSHTYYDDILNKTKKYLSIVSEEEHFTNVKLKYDSCQRIISELFQFNAKHWLYFDFDDEEQTQGDKVTIDPFIQLASDIFKIINCDELGNIIITGWEGECTFDNVNYVFKEINYIIDVIKNKILSGKMFLLASLDLHRSFEELLMENNNIIMSKTREKCTILHFLANLNRNHFIYTSLDVISRSQESLSKKHKFINVQLQGSRNTALHLAAYKKNDFIARQLLIHGAYFDINNIDNQEPLDLCHKSNRDIQKLLNRINSIFKEAEMSTGGISVFKKFLNVTPNWVNFVEKLVMERLNFDECLAILNCKSVKNNKSILEIHTPWRDLLIKLAKKSQLEIQLSKDILSYNKQLEDISREHKEKVVKIYEEMIEINKEFDSLNSQFEQAKTYSVLADLVDTKKELTEDVISKRYSLLRRSRDIFYAVLDKLRGPAADNPLNSVICSYIAPVEHELKTIDGDNLRTHLSDDSSRAIPKAATSTCAYDAYQEARPSPERLDAQIRQLVYAVEGSRKQNHEQHRAIMSKLDELIKINAKKETQKPRSAQPPPPPVSNHNMDDDLYQLYNDEEFSKDWANFSNASLPTPGRTPSFPPNLFPQAPRHPYSPLVYPPYQGLPFDPSTLTTALTAYNPMNSLSRGGLDQQPLTSMQQMSETLLQQGLYGQKFGEYSQNQPLQPMAPPMPSMDPARNVDPKLSFRASNEPSVPESSALKDTLTSTTPSSAAARKVPPVNVVITTSDTLPTTQPMLSVTIPAQHRLSSMTTGEENEEERYCARAKLFRFADKKWKDCGIGNVKLLKNADGKVRLLMCCEQVLKICANHVLHKDMELLSLPENDKTFIWVADDLTNEGLKEELFYVSFERSEEAATFKEQFCQAKITARNSVPEKNASFVTTAKGVSESAVNIDYIFGEDKSMFGSDAKPPAMNIFGTAKPPTGNIFGCAAATPAGGATNSIFGSQSGGAVFGGQTAPSFGSLAAQASNPPAPAPLFASKGFGAPIATTTTAAAAPATTTTTSSSLFGDVSNQFASKLSFGQTTAPTTNLFGSTAPTPTANLFGAKTATTAPPTAAAPKDAGKKDGGVSFLPTENSLLFSTSDANTDEKKLHNEIVFYHKVTYMVRDKGNKEWKESGGGILYILQDIEGNVFRLILCCCKQTRNIKCNMILNANCKFLTHISEKTITWKGVNDADLDKQKQIWLAFFEQSDLANQFKKAINKVRKTTIAKGYKFENKGDEDDEEDEEDEENMKMFERRVTLFAQNEGENAWSSLGMGNLKVIYDSDFFGARIIIESDAKQIVSDTVISIDTTMQCIEKECSWAAIDYACEPAIRRTLKTLFSTPMTAQEMYQAFQEGHECATKVDIRE